MKITLEMVDQVIDRTGATYQDAKEVLIKCEGDVLEAIVLLDSKEKSAEENLIMKKLKELVEKGKISRILVEKNERNIINIPILAGVIGGIVFSGATVFGLTAAILSGCEIYVINENDQRINIKEYTKEKYNEVINRNKKSEFEDMEDKEEN
jgi:hypothetical protein